MRERVDTVVVGAGQAGLSVSYHLRRLGRPHVVLEQGRVGETWRTRRWDGFLLNTPNFALQLPGQEYDGDDPEGFLTRDETVAYLERYAAAAVRTGVRVAALAARAGRGYLLETSAGPLEAANVVVATGAFQQPAPVPVPGELAPSIRSLHSSEYLRPGQLPPGGVLVVGTGQSGCQIADELNRAGRRVYLSVGRCPSFPMHYRGRQAVAWLIDIGLMDETVDTLPSPAAKLACNPTIESEAGHLCGPRRLAREGVTRVGRIEEIDGWRIAIRPDLAESFVQADEFAARLRQRIDDYVHGAGLDAPTDSPNGPNPVADGGIRELDLGAAGIGSVLWANGFRPDFGWIRLPVLASDGWPVHVRGVTSVPGLYFVGMHWLHKRKSALLLGVGEDAEHIASTIVDDNRPREHEQSGTA